ncbi:MAG: hypothetical protein D6679_06155 [Candidatus Hydrogenedentota bacterium]|nr:MAG: hypothetical protein D6679_06155 [Candidatus Hydrogenedentota bacterium]
MLVLDFPGLADALPAGGIECPAGPVARIRHSLHTEEPPEGRVVLDLRSTDIDLSVASTDAVVTLVILDRKELEKERVGEAVYQPTVSAAKRRIEILGGNFQRGLVGTELPIPLTVRVFDPNEGAPVSGVRVLFTSTNPDVKISPSSATASADGVATTRVTLPYAGGRVVVTARVEGTAAEASFELYAVARKPDVIKPVGDGVAKGITRKESTQPLEVVVLDAFGNPVPGVEVKWTYIDGNGRLDVDPKEPGNQDVSVTGPDGKARLARWTAGPRPGIHRIQAAFTVGEVTRFTQFEINVAPQLVSMDFYQTPVPDILRFLGRIANWNLVLSDGVIGLATPEITVHLENMPIDEALDKILSMKNLTRIEEADGSIRIVTFVEAMTRGQEIVTDPSLLETLPQDVVKTVVLTVPTRDVEQISQAIPNLLTTNAKIISSPATGQIIITDFVANIRRVYEIIRNLGEFQPHLIRVKYLDAPGLDAYLQTMISSQEKTLTGDGWILLVGAEATAKRIEEFVEEIDVPENAGLFATGATQGEAAITKIYPVRYTTAERIQPILTQIFQQAELQVGVKKEGTAAANAPEAKGQGTEKKGANAAAKGTAQSTARVVQKILVVADARTNKLIVTAPEPLFPSIEAVITELDTAVGSGEPLVLRAEGIDVTLLDRIIQEMYPGVRSFADAATRREIVFVPKDFDKKQIRSLLGSIQQAAESTDTVVIRKLRYANAATLAQVFQTLQTQIQQRAASGQEKAAGTGKTAQKKGAPPSPAGSLAALATTRIGDVNIVPYAPTNSLIMIGPEEVIPAVLQLVESLDEPEGRWEVYPLANADAVTVAPTLGKIFPTAQFFDERSSNSIFVVVNSRDELPDIKRAIEYLDQPRGATVNDTTLIIPLRNSDAAEVTNILRNVFSNENVLSRISSFEVRSNEAVNSVLDFLREQDRAQQRQNIFRVNPITSKNILVIQAPVELALEALRLIQKIEEAEPYSDPTAGEYVKVYHVEHLLPSQLMDLINRTIAEVRIEEQEVKDPQTGRTTTVTRTTSTIRSVAEDSLKTLIAYANTNDHMQIEQLIKHFDNEKFAEHVELQFKEYKVEHADPVRLGKWLNDNMLNQGDVTGEMLLVDPEDSTIKMWVFEATMERMKRIWPTMDRADFSFSPYQIFSSSRISPANLQTMITTLYPALAQKTALLDDVQAVIVFADREVLREIEGLVEELDQQRTALVEVQYADLATVHTALNEAYPGLGVSEVEGHLLLRGRDAEQLQAAIRTIRVLDNQNVTVIRLKAITSADAVSFLGAAFPDVTFTELADLHAVGFSASPEKTERIRMALNRVDGADTLPIVYREYEVKNADPVVLGGLLWRGLLNVGVTAEDNLEEFYRVSGNTIRVWARPYTQKKIAEILPELDQKGVVGNPNTVFDFYIFKNAPVNGLRAAENTGISGDDLLSDVSTILGNARISGLAVSAISGQGGFVLLGGTPDGVAQAKEFLARMDEAWGKAVLGAKFRLFTLRYRTPTAFVSDVTRIMAGHLLEMIPQDERGELLVISPPEILEKVASLIEEFDTVIPIRYFSLKNVTPTEMQTYLQSLYPNLFVIAADAQQNLAVRANESLLREVAAVVEELDNVGVHVARVNNVTADEMVALLQTAYPNLQFTALPTLHHIAFAAPARLAEEVKESIKKFDNLDKNERYYRRRGVFIDMSGIQGNLSTLFPDIEFVVVQTTPPGWLVARGTPERIDQLDKLIDVMDTYSAFRVYEPKVLSTTDLTAALSQMMTATDVSIQTVGPWITISGSEEAVANAVDLLKKMDALQGVRVLKFGRLSTTDAQTILQTFYPSLVITTSANAGILLAQGSEEALDGAEKLLADVEAGMRWKVYHLSKVSASEAVTAVTGLFGTINIQELPAGNGVGILATPQQIAEVTEFLSRLDRNEFRLFPVTEADLATVASALTTLFPNAVIQTVDYANRIVASADSRTMGEIAKMIEALDKSVHTAIRPIRYYAPTTADNQDDIDALKTTVQSYLSGNGQIQYDRQSNSFIITDSLDKVRRALKVIDDLDRAPPQFLIEVAVAEVNLTDVKNLGISWSFRPDLTDFGLSPPVPMPPANSPELPLSDAPGTMGGAQVNFDVNGGPFQIGIARNNLQAVLTALLSKNDGRVITSPKIVLRNNVAGSVDLSQTIPTVVQTRDNAGQQTFSAGTPQTIPIKLTVTPSGTWNSDLVRLTVDAAISAVTGAANPQTGEFPFVSRTVSSTVDLRDGQTLILGGLMVKNETKDVKKVPLLGDIPGIGQLFRTTSKTDVNTEILILITPRFLYPQTHELQMEEELNRFKYLVNLPVDWSGRRWLVNNRRRLKDIWKNRPIRGNHILMPGQTLGAGGAITGPAPVPAPSSAAPAAAAAPAVSPPPVAVSEAAPVEVKTSPVRVEAPEPAPSPAPEHKAPPLTGSIRTLNVNTATAEELKRIPDMPGYVAELIVRYRGENGPFRSVNELVKVPGMTPDLLDKVSPYLRVVSVTAPVGTPPSPAVPSKNPLPTPSPAPAVPRTKVNINTADVRELMTLPGIQENHARMIIAYRNTYGSFTTVDALIDVPGISPTMFGKIRPYLTVGTGEAVSGTAGRISSSTPAAPAAPAVSAAPPPAAPSPAGPVNINTATEAELKTIPEFNIQNVKLILAYRQNYGAFSSVDDLLNVPSITPELLARVRDRLTVSGSAARPAPTPSAPPSTVAPSTKAQPIDINTATEQDLAALPELSTQNIKLILAYRASYGAFESVDELLDVPSITPELLAKIRDRLIVR